VHVVMTLCIRLALAAVRAEHILCRSYPLHHTCLDAAGSLRTCSDDGSAIASTHPLHKTFGLACTPCLCDHLPPLCITAQRRLSSASRTRRCCYCSRCGPGQRKVPGTQLAPAPASAPTWQAISVMLVSPGSATSCSSLQSAQRRDHLPTSCSRWNKRAQTPTEIEWRPCPPRGAGANSPRRSSTRLSFDRRSRNKCAIRAHSADSIPLIRAKTLRTKQISGCVGKCARLLDNLRGSRAVPPEYPRDRALVPAAIDDPMIRAYRSRSRRDACPMRFGFCWPCSKLNSFPQRPPALMQRVL
jgi:hypothetical protein